MILNKYIYRETLLVFMAVLSILLLIYISHRFVRYLAEAAAGSIPADVIFKLLGLQLLRKLEIFMPVAFYIAVLISIGRMYKDNEIIAMNSGGIGLMTVIGNIFRLSLIFAGVTMILSLYVSPQIMSIQNEYREKAKEKSDITGIYPGQFRDLKNGQRVIYVEDVSPDKRSMENIFVQVREKDRNDIVIADSAYQTVDARTGARSIVLEGGRRYAGEPGQLDFVVTRFERYAIRTEERVGRPAHRQRIDTIPTVDLLRALERPTYAAELQWRLSFPLSLIVLSLLAVIFARASSGGGKYARLVTAILAYFVYSNLIGIAKMLVERGDLSPAIGLLPVHGAALLIIATALFLDHLRGTWRGSRIP